MQCAHLPTSSGGLRCYQPSHTTEFQNRRARTSVASPLGQRMPRRMRMYCSASRYEGRYPRSTAPELACAQDAPSPQSWPYRTADRYANAQRVMVYSRGPAAAAMNA